jgi:D-alanine-D-alanine ligase
VPTLPTCRRLAIHSTCMSSSSNKKNISPAPFIWVIAPLVETGDAHLDYYYNYTQSIEEYTKAFKLLNIKWQWQFVTLYNFIDIIQTIAQQLLHTQIVVVNLCDGDEKNGIPGISVIQLLEEKNIPYTGASEYFYHITTSKIPMKKLFDLHHISTPSWKYIPSANTPINHIFEQLGTPLILKPAVSGGSMGVPITNVVSNVTALQLAINTIFNGYRGWQLTTDGALVEQFINGPEYTTFIIGSYLQPINAIIYPPVERGKFMKKKHRWPTMNLFTNMHPLPIKN